MKSEPCTLPSFPVLCKAELGYALVLLCFTMKFHFQSPRLVPHQFFMLRKFLQQANHLIDYLVLFLVRAYLTITKCDCV